jgi:hypothetical protein
MKSLAVELDGSVINTDGNAGRNIFVGAVDPAVTLPTGARALAAGDIWIATGSVSQDQTLKEYTGTTAVTAPSAGLKIASRLRGGRRLLIQKGPAGIETPLQPHFGMNKIARAAPAGNATTMTTEGIVLTATGTATAANFATTNALTQSRRISYLSAATAGSNGGVREAVAKYWRGNAAGLGGFYMVCRFGYVLLPAGWRMFIGFTSATAALANGDPSALLNLVGIAKDTADTNLWFIYNDGAGACTKTDTGLAAPAVNEIWEARIFAAPNDSHIQMSIGRILGGAESLAEHDSGASSNIPANTQTLAWQFWCNNGTTASAIDPHLVQLYTEVDN